MIQIMKTEDMNTAIRLLELENKLSGTMDVVAHQEKEDGTVITDTEKIEDGMRVKVVLSKTWQEIWDAVRSGVMVVLKEADDDRLSIYHMRSIGKPGAMNAFGNVPVSYYVGFNLNVNNFSCENPTDYPYYVYTYQDSELD